MHSTTLASAQQQNAKHLPGYTGYRPQYVEERTSFPLPQMEKQVGRVPGKIAHILSLSKQSLKSPYVGYCGYIPGVKAENVFGESYGKSSSQSSKGQIIRGFDQGPQDKFKSVAQASFQNQKELQQKLRAAAN